MSGTRLVGVLGAVASVATILGWLGLEFDVFEREARTVAQTSVASAPVPSAPPTFVSVEPAGCALSVVDDLSSNQYVETVEVTVGSASGSLTVDQTNPRDSVELTLPRAGRYRYELVSLTEARSVDGDTRRYRGAGAGTLTCTDGATFEVNLVDYQRDPWRIELTTAG